MALSEIIENGVLFHEDRNASLAGTDPEIVTDEESIVRSMHTRLNALPRNPNTSSRPTFFRVPPKLRKDKENLIEPSVVSIGPYHHNRKHLKPMEEIKWLLLQDILSQSKKNVTLTIIVEKMKGMQLQTRSCYREYVKMDHDRFIEMLILDGTFIIQFMLKPIKWFKREIGWASACIATDLILLENQIPFFVVQSLWNLYFSLPLTLAHFKRLANRLCTEKNLVHVTTPPENINHLLHLYHHYVVPDMSEHQTVLPRCIDFQLCTVLSSNGLLSCTSPEYQEPSSVIPCATELKEAGIKFRKKRSPCNLMDVTFQGSTLEIPSIKIDDRIKPLLLNLLALEQSDVLPNYLTSYVIFMNFLINTDNDVAILQRRGIIQNMLSSEEEVAQFFNQLSKGAVIYDGHYLTDLVKKVSQHYNLKCRKYRAKLMHNYFNNPWSILSLLAAFILLGLTIAQTYFAGYAYFHPSQSPKAS